MTLNFFHQFLFFSSNLKSNEIIIDFEKMDKNKPGDFFLFYNLFGDMKITNPNQYQGLFGSIINRTILEKKQVTLEEFIGSFKDWLLFHSDSAVLGSERRFFYRFMKFLVQTNPELDYIELHFLYKESPWFIVGYRENLKIVVSIFQGDNSHIAYHEMDITGKIKFSIEKYRKFYNLYMKYDNSYET